VLLPATAAAAAYRSATAARRREARPWQLGYGGSGQIGLVLVRISARRTGQSDDRGAGGRGAWHWSRPAAQRRGIGGIGIDALLNTCSLSN